MKNIKFTMELVWHNCLEYLPEENYNGRLYMTNGYEIFPVTFVKTQYWYVWCYAESGQNINIQPYHYWADIEQTIQGDERFKSQNETY